MDRGAWWAAVYGVAQSRTWLKQLSSSSILLDFTWPYSSWLSTYLLPRQLVSSPLTLMFWHHRMNCSLSPNRCVCAWVCNGSVRWYLSMALIYIYQMISNADHLFICYWPSISLLWKTCLFRSSAHFLTGLFVFLYWLVWGVYMFWI